MPASPAPIAKMSKKDLISEARRLGIPGTEVKTVAILRREVGIQRKVEAKAQAALANALAEEAAETEAGPDKAAAGPVVETGPVVGSIPAAGAPAATKVAKAERLDRPNSQGGWDLALWVKGERPLVEDLVARLAAAKTPRHMLPSVFDEDGAAWLHVPGFDEVAQAAHEQVLDLLYVNDNAYHGWLLGILLAQLRQAFPGIETDDRRLASRVAGELNALRDAGTIADWRPYSPATVDLRFRLTHPDGTVEMTGGPRATSTRIAALRAEAAA